MPCELIENNGAALKECILAYTDLWNLDEAFKSWVENHIQFYNTLVDRIVPGHPGEAEDDKIRAIGEEDPFATIGEYYHQWVIEKGESLETILPLKSAGLNVIYPKELKPFRDRKVRVLNGAHTAMVSVGIRAKVETVGELMNHPDLGPFLIELMREEIAPTIQQYQEEILNYVDEIVERFKNPFIKHKLSDISLNSISKFKTRLFPSFFDYIELKGHPPRKIAYCFQVLIESMKTNSESLNFRDDPKILSVIKNNEFDEILKSQEMWGSWQARLEDAMRAVERSS